MKKIAVFDKNLKEIKNIELNDNVFSIEPNENLIHQVMVSMMANLRRAIAHTKTRSDVSGGGKKPWKQKGTGRARHGSRRSPIWKGGGVTFGPTKERNFKKEINKKMKRKALMMVLSAKAKNDLLLILDKIVLEKNKTKLMAEIIKKLLNDKSSLIALPKKEENIIRAANNLPKIQVTETRNLNCLDLLSFKYLIMPKASIS